MIGVLGELHPNAYKEFGFNKTSCVVLELNLEPLLNAKVSLAKMSPISRFPTVSRDLALIVDKKVNAGDIIKQIKVSGKGLIKDANIFDVYEGQNIIGNRKSVAVNLLIGKDETLTEKEINDLLDKIKYDLAKNLQAELRA